MKKILLLITNLSLGVFSLSSCGKQENITVTESKKILVNGVTDFETQANYSSFNIERMENDSPLSKEVDVFNYSRPDLKEAKLTLPHHKLFDLNILNKENSNDYILGFNEYSEIRNNFSSTKTFSLGAEFLKDIISKANLTAMPDQVKVIVPFLFLNSEPELKLNIRGIKDSINTHNLNLNNTKHLHMYKYSIVNGIINPEKFYFVKDNGDLLFSSYSKIGVKNYTGLFKKENVKWEYNLNNKFNYAWDHIGYREDIVKEEIPLVVSGDEWKLQKIVSKNLKQYKSIMINIKSEVNTNEYFRELKNNSFDIQNTTKQIGNSFEVSLNNPAHTNFNFLVAKGIDKQVLFAFKSFNDELYLSYKNNQENTFYHFDLKIIAEKDHKRVTNIFKGFKNVSGIRNSIVDIKSDGNGMILQAYKNDKDWNSYNFNGNKLELTSQYNASSAYPDGGWMSYVEYKNKTIAINDDFSKITIGQSDEKGNQVYMSKPIYDSLPVGYQAGWADAVISGNKIFFVNEDINKWIKADITTENGRVHFNNIEKWNVDKRYFGYEKGWRGAEIIRDKLFFTNSRPSGIKFVDAIGFLHNGYKQLTPICVIPQTNISPSQWMDVKLINNRLILLNNNMSKTRYLDNYSEVSLPIK